MACCLSVWLACAPNRPPRAPRSRARRQASNPKGARQGARRRRCALQAPCARPKRGAGSQALAPITPGDTATLSCHSPRSTPALTRCLRRGPRGRGPSSMRRTNDRLAMRCRHRQDAYRTPRRRSSVRSTTNARSLGSRCVAVDRRVTHFSSTLAWRRRSARSHGSQRWVQIAWPCARRFSSDIAVGSIGGSWASLARSPVMAVATGEPDRESHRGQVCRAQFAQAGERLPHRGSRLGSSERRARQASRRCRLSAPVRGAHRR